MNSARNEWSARAWRGWGASVARYAY